MNDASFFQSGDVPTTIGYEGANVVMEKSVSQSVPPRDPSRHLVKQQAGELRTQDSNLAITTLY